MKRAQDEFNLLVWIVVYCQRVVEVCTYALNILLKVLYEFSGQNLIQSSNLKYDGKR